MSQQVAARWTRKAWDLYVEQVAGSVTEPEVGGLLAPPQRLPIVTFVCPFCLQMQSGMDLAQEVGSDAFTARWRECQHAVSVDGPLFGSDREGTGTVLTTWSDETGLG